MALSTSPASVRQAKKTTVSSRRLSLPLLFPLIFAGVLLSHWALLRLPYFWDEGGYYVPAALDFLRTGTLIPQSTITNAHPPLPSMLLAGWWHLFGFSILATRTLVCLVAGAALLAVYKLARDLVSPSVAAATTLLTACYPVWFAQSSLAHADIFAATFTLWALTVYLDPKREGQKSRLLPTALLFSLAVLSKETAVVTPLALAVWEAMQAIRRGERSTHLRQAFALSVPTLPLLAWYAFHFGKTGFIFGNPEFLRYNATANLDAHRIVLCLWHRCLHLLAHMNMFVAVGTTIAMLLIPANSPSLARRVNIVLAVILCANLLEFSVLGGALLTRYLLPLFPLVLLLCVVEWQRRVRQWGWLVGLTTAAFVCGLFINPPYSFAPEDNLAYRDMIVLHQQAIAVLAAHYPTATVLTAWPATSELSRPELGYTHLPFQVVSIPNFSLDQLEKAAAALGSYETALVFSTKWEPPSGKANLSQAHEPADIRYFDFHHDLHPLEAANLLHGEIVWQAYRKGQWAAVLRFPKTVEAQVRACGPRLTTPCTPL